MINRPKFDMTDVSFINMYTEISLARTPVARLPPVARLYIADMGETDANGQVVF